MTINLVSLRALKENRSTGTRQTKKRGMRTLRFSKFGIYKTKPFGDEYLTIKIF